MTASLCDEENLQQISGGENKLQNAACQRPERNDWVSNLNSPHLDIHGCDWASAASPSYARRDQG
jgi:hypothetical protein